MSREVGVWIDHRRAIIAILTGKTEEETRQVTSDLEKRMRYSGGQPEDAAEDQRDRRFIGHLNKYYDDVIASLGGADAILILGPGEAKAELLARLRHGALGARVVGVETADKMTDRQVAARVRQRFLKVAAGLAAAEPAHSQGAEPPGSDAHDVDEAEYTRR